VGFISVGYAARGGAGASRGRAGASRGPRLPTVAPLATIPVVGHYKKVLGAGSDETFRIVKILNVEVNVQLSRFQLFDLTS
ncbi:hypothetical protein ACLOJK_007259, partial [Asimina triloba]